MERLGRYADLRLHPRARITPGVLVYRLVFANIGYVRGRIREAIAGSPAPVRWLVFDAEALNHVDATAVHALKQLIGSLQDEGITLVVARLKGPMQQTFREVGLLDLVGERHVYATVCAAVQAARPAREGA